MPLSYLRSYNKNMINADNCPLLSNLNKIYTTPMGSERIRKNLSLGESITDVVDFCKKKISSPDCKITRQGKNWYCEIDGIYITVNAYSYTIITAHTTAVKYPRSSRLLSLSKHETTITKRPSFTAIKSYEEFSKYYWYREELQTICKSLNIDASGMKAELNHNIEEYFKGNFIPPKKSNTFSPSVTKHHTSPKAATSITTLTTQTSLIECGFCFNQRFRDFFSQQTGIDNFKFNVDMVATVRKVKETNDISFTLGDLLDIFYGTKTYAKYDKVSLQWNKFVHDFCADPATTHFKNKLKTASILWKEVRTSTREKIYTTELLKEFSDIINKEN
ncbi:Protein of unknown function [Treponema bryantii]|uniref:SAP domain-containing protein n=2 Tax=Treponema bryantii TaxID=163 RepID=A0A1H9H507_9SPIR|nr:Protein of unknown function [Treponema bryantii]